MTLLDFDDNLLHGKHSGYQSHKKSRGKEHNFNFPSEFSRSSK